MLHLITTFKPFVGAPAEHQRAALASWRTHSRARIVVLGDREEGALAASAEHGAQVVPTAALRTALDLGLGYGAPLLDAAVEHAERLSAPGDVLAWINADIVLTRPVDAAIEAVFAAHEDPFCAVRRYNVERSCDAGPDAGWLEAPSGADVFLWRHGFFRRHGVALKPYIIGRMAWDSYLMGLAVVHGRPPVDLTLPLHVCHPEHDYSHLSGVEAGRCPRSTTGHHHADWCEVEGRNLNYDLFASGDWADMSDARWLQVQDVPSIR